MPTDQFFHTQTVAESIEPGTFVEASRWSFDIPDFFKRHGVVVEAQPMHFVSRLPHQDLSPGIIRSVRTAGDLEDPIAAQISDVGLLTPVEVGLVLWPHVPSAAPVLVAHPEIRQSPWLIAPILPP